MDGNPIDEFRLSVMQDVLPVGMAMFDRVREGGPRKLFEIFRQSDNPLNELQAEGSLRAATLRDRLDMIRPGLGNPIMSVKVSIDSKDFETDDYQLLLEHLRGIESKLDDLEQILDSDSFGNSKLPKE